MLNELLNLNGNHASQTLKLKGYLLIQIVKLRAFNEEFDENRFDLIWNDVFL
jgi:hypothetical protein